MRARLPNVSVKLFLTSGACLALTGCALTSPPRHSDASVQPPANQQSGAVSVSADAGVPRLAEEFDQRILSYLEDDRLAEASELAAMYGRQFPDRPTPWLFQATVLNRQERLAEAEALYRASIERFPKNEEFLLGFTLVLGKLQRIHEAAPLLERKLAESDEWSASFYALYAQVVLLDQAEEGKAQTSSVYKAIELLNTATELEPARAELWLRKSELERAVKDFPAAAHSIEKIQQLLPENEQVAQALVALYLQQGRYAEVSAQIALLVSLQAEDVDDLIQMSVQHALQLKDVTQAIAFAKEGAELLPANTDVQFLYGNVLVRTRSFAEGESVLAAARTNLYREQADSYDPRLELYYGIALLQQQNVEAATEVLTELAAQQFDAELSEYMQLLFGWRDVEALANLAALFLTAESSVPESAYLPYFRAMIHHYLAEHTAARDAFFIAEKRAESLPSGKEDILNDHFYFQLASACERSGHFDEAEAGFRKVLELNPKRADAMNYMAYMWAEKGVRLDEAGEWITKAMALGSNVGAFIDTLGWVYYQQGKYDEALPQLLRAAELVPDDPSVFDHLGDCAMSLGRPQEARAYWLKSLELAPNDAIQAKADAVPAE
jgi:tetratricopeptide (TPR) repeat protein